MKKNVILIGYCKDKPGIAKAITDFIYNNGGNIENDQTKIVSDYEFINKKPYKKDDYFVFRYEWNLDDGSISESKLIDKFKEISDYFEMEWKLNFSDKIYNLAIFVTKEQHCLKDILSRKYQGKLRINVPLIISNHPSSKFIDLEHIVNTYGGEYYVFPITNENKIKQEQKEVELLKEKNIDLIILAKYRQILSERFINEFPNKIINVHDSRLPRYPGSYAYIQAYSKGAKSIGATTHFITPELDKGPIIDEEWEKITGLESYEDIVKKGHDMECLVLARTIDNYINDKILLLNNKRAILFK